MKNLWNFATQILHLVPKKNLKHVKGILKEFEEIEQSEEGFLASIILRILDYTKEEIGKEKKINKLLKNTNPIRQCQRNKENQPQKESSTLSSNKPGSIDPSKSQDIIPSNQKLLEGSLQEKHFNYSKEINSLGKNRSLIKNEAVILKHENEIEGEIYLPQSIKMYKVSHSLEGRPFKKLEMKDSFDHSST
ncbi:hypothetical protein O181_133104 [Austropuccinia psidii MF-1]|uniref:Uncharacterized protein n=1 Tax=Austropuccinia psidii MF-1 TaxID=1389203 RepID=A0A9Q3QCP0_9BASI|nr:hypothetical protein [Austropuccinia psidii MF-1]